MPDPQFDPFEGGQISSGGGITVRTRGPGAPGGVPPNAPSPAGALGSQQSGDPWAGWVDAGPNAPPRPTGTPAPVQMQMLPGGQNPPAPQTGDPWGGWVDAGPQTPQAAEPIGQGEAIAHGVAHGATASWSPVLAGSLHLGARYEMLDSLMQAKSMGMLDANGEQMLQQIQSELADPMKIYRAERDREQASVTSAGEQWPKTMAASEIGGALATPIPWAKAREAGAVAQEAANVGGKLIEPMTNAVKNKVAPWVSQMIAAAKAGAGYGATTGAGASASQGDDLGTSAWHTVTGGLLGAIVGTVASPLLSAGGAAITAGKEKLASMGRGIASDLGMKTPEVMAEQSVRNAEAAGAPFRQAKWRPKDNIRNMNQAGALAEEEGALVRGNQGDLPTARLARTAADTSDAAANAIKEHTQNVFAGQAKRVANGIRIMMMDRGKVGPEEITKKIEALEEQARRELRGSYDALYKANEKGITSDELQHLSGAAPIQTAMRDAYKRWQSRAIADKGVGAPPPGIDITRNATKRRAASGAMRSGASNQDFPIIPNIQFWDLVKREMDQQIRAAERNPQPRGDDVGLLKSLRGQLRTELDNLTNGFYSHVVGGAASKFKTLGVDAKNMFEAGAKFVTAKGGDDFAGGARKLDDEFEKLINGATPAERELFKYGFITNMITKLEDHPDRLDVLNQIWLGAPGKGSESARRRIEMAVGEKDAKKLEALLSVEAVMDQMRQAQGNSHTGEKIKKYLSEGGLAGGAALFGAETWRTSNPEEDSWFEEGKKWSAVAGLLFGALAARRGRQFDEEVANSIAHKLLSGSPEAEKDVVNSIANSPKLLQALREGRAQLAAYLKRSAASAGIAYTQPYNKGTPVQEAPASPQ